MGVPGASKYQYIAPLTRLNTDVDCYRFDVSRTNWPNPPYTSGDHRYRIIWAISNGGYTQLSFVLDDTIPFPCQIMGESDGTDHTNYIDEVAKETVSNATISAPVRAGVFMQQITSQAAVQADNWGTTDTWGVNIPAIMQHDHFSGGML